MRNTHSILDIDLERDTAARRRLELTDVTDFLEDAAAQVLLEQSRKYSQDGATLAKLQLAEQTLRRALEIEPDNEQARKMLQQLELGDASE